MNTSAEAADQIVRMSLTGTETVLTLSGKGAKELGVLLYKLLKDLSQGKKKTKGRTRLNNMLKSGKQLEVYQIQDADVKKFCTEAKKYGVVYTILKDRNKNDGLTEIMVKTDDRAKIDRIYEKLDLAPLNISEIKAEAQKENSEKNPPDRSSAEKTEEEKFLDRLMKKPNPTKEETQTENPTEARTKQSRSVPNSKKAPEASSTEREFAEKPSVRKKLETIQKKQENEKAKNLPEKQKTNNHKQPKKKRKEKER